MNKDNIKKLCNQFGKNMVKSVLIDKMYQEGYIATSGIDIPLQGSYTQNKIYKELLSLINDC
jgi:hypothetical protein